MLNDADQMFVALFAVAVHPVMDETACGTIVVEKLGKSSADVSVAVEFFLGEQLVAQYVKSLLIDKAGPFTFSVEVVDGNALGVHERKKRTRPVRAFHDENPGVDPVVIECQHQVFLHPEQPDLIERQGDVNEDAVAIRPYDVVVKFQRVCHQGIFVPLRVEPRIHGHVVEISDDIFMRVAVLLLVEL